MRNRAEVVIVGSGGFGASTAYHLAKRGMRDVILLDRYDLGSQTSPLAAGLTSKVARTELMVKLVNEAVEALAGFESVTGRSIRFHRVGALILQLLQSWFLQDLSTYGIEGLNSDIITTRRYARESRDISMRFVRSMAKGVSSPSVGEFCTVLEFWAERFPNHKSNHFIFPFERYGGKGEDDAFGFAGSSAYSTNPSKPMGSWKKAWQAAKQRAGVTCRFHDLRHTGCTRMLEAGVPFSVVSDIMGLSASTAVRMAKRYGHIGHSARREAVDKLSNATGFDSEGAQKWAQFTIRCEPLSCHFANKMDCFSNPPVFHLRGTWTRTSDFS